MSDLFEKAWQDNFMKNQKKIKIGHKTLIQFLGVGLFLAPSYLENSKS